MPKHGDIIIIHTKRGGHRPGMGLIPSGVPIRLDPQGAPIGPSCSRAGNQAGASHREGNPMTSTTTNPTAAQILASYIAAPLFVPASRYVPTAHSPATLAPCTERARDGATIIPGALDW